jgi:hypothetical protein
MDVRPWRCLLYQRTNALPRNFQRVGLSAKNLIRNQTTDVADDHTYHDKTTVVGHNLYMEKYKRKRIRMTFLRVLKKIYS